MDKNSDESTERPQYLQNTSLKREYSILKLYLLEARVDASTEQRDFRDRLQALF
jgi:hypothetical protein